MRDVMQYKRLGRKENRLLFLDPHTQDVFLWRPPGIFNRAKVRLLALRLRQTFLHRA